MAFEFIERSPCSTCPYRQDAKLALWDPQYFVDLLRHDLEPLGAMYGCHKYARQERKSFCAGWLLDQRRRRFPNMGLRLRLMTNETLGEAVLSVLSDGGHALYPSLEAMCRANLTARPESRQRRRRPSSP